MARKKRTMDYGPEQGVHMKNRQALLIVALISFLMPVLAEASKTTYIYTDRRFNFVKRVELSEDELKGVKRNQPFNFSDLQMRDMLAGVKLSKQLILDKQTKEQTVFDQAALDFLVPYLTKAFKEAEPNEEVVFSVLSQTGQILMHDNRLTIASVWVEGDGLHLKFRKLMAKIMITSEKMGDVSQAINRAQGLRVSLEAGPGQEFGNSTEELIVKIPDANATAVVAASVKEGTMDQGLGTRDHGLGTMDQKPKTAKTVDAVAIPSSSVEERLKKLENLKKQGLVNDEEYKQKRQEILQQL